MTDYKPTGTSLSSKDLIHQLTAFKSTATSAKMVRSIREPSKPALLRAKSIQSRLARREDSQPAPQVAVVARVTALAQLIKVVMAFARTGSLISA